MNSWRRCVHCPTTVIRQDNGLDLWPMQSVVCHVRSLPMPVNSAFPTPPPASPISTLLATGQGSILLALLPRCAADLTANADPTFLFRSSCSLFPGTGASNVRHTNFTFFSFLTRANMTSLLALSVCTYNCHPKTWSDGAPSTICSGVWLALLLISCTAPYRAHALAMPRSPSG